HVTGVQTCALPISRARRLEDGYSAPALSARIGHRVADDQVVAYLLDRAPEDPTVAALLDEVLDAWAFGLSVLILVSDPDKVILAGAAADLDDITMETLSARVSRIVPSMPATIRATDATAAIFAGGEQLAVRTAFEHGLTAQLGPATPTNDDRL